MKPQEKPPLRIVPRLLSRPLCAEYLSVSVDTVDRLINSGAIEIVRLPGHAATRHDRTRNILVDREALDQLIASWRERKGA